MLRLQTQHHHAQLFMWVWGIQAQDFMHGPLHWLSHLPIPRITFMDAMSPWQWVGLWDEALISGRFCSLQ